MSLRKTPHIHVWRPAGLVLVPPPCLTGLEDLKPKPELKPEQSQGGGQSWKDKPSHEVKLSSVKKKAIQNQPEIVAVAVAVAVAVVFVLVVCP